MGSRQDDFQKSTLETFRNFEEMAILKLRYTNYDCLFNLYFFPMCLCFHLSSPKIIMTSNIKKRERFETVLGQVACLKTMTEAEKSLIADVVIEKSFSEGDSVYKIDDPLGDAGKFYIVEQGGLKILDSSGSDDVATFLSSGDVFGHIELLDETLDKRVTTAVVTENETKVLVMQGDSFKRIIAEDNSHIFTPEAPISI